MSIVSLVSGGIDSLVMAKIIDRQGILQVPFFINYGQLAAEREWNACKQVLKLCDLPAPQKIDVSGYGKYFRTGITSTEKDIKESAFLPGRNLMFLLLASSLARSKGFNKVAIGLLSEKYSIFPDQTQEFIVNTNFAINSALNDTITIVTPLMQFSKNDVLELAKKIKLPLEKTYSCHAGGEKYCGKCIACEEIAKTEVGRKLPQFKKRGR